MQRNALYTISSTDEFISDMIAKGWEGVQLREGSLGVGDWVLIAPNERKWNFVIKEVPTSSWSSLQSIRRCRKLSQKILKEIEKVAEQI